MSYGKTRVVSFRLSEAEYQHLLHTCAAKGARTLSEIARLIVCSLIQSDDSDAPETLANRVTQINRNVVALNDEVKRLAATIQAALEKSTCNVVVSHDNEEHSSDC